MARLALLDAVYLLLGLGLLPALGVARSRRELLRLAPAALLVGLAAGGLLAAEFALLDAPLTLGELAFAAVLALAVGAWRLRRAPGGAGARGSRLDLALAAVPVLAAAALLLRAAPAFAVRPLLEWDGWAIWGTKAQALSDLHGVRNGVFESGAYPHPDYPILLPALEAGSGPPAGVRSTSSCSCSSLRSPPRSGRSCAGARRQRSSRSRSSPWSRRPTCSTSSRGTTPTCRSPAWPPPARSRSWSGSEDGDRGMLVLAAIFLVAAALTKNEGLLFGFAALVAAAVAALLARRSPLPLAAVADSSCSPSRRGGCSSARIASSEDFDLANLAHPGYLGDHSGRIWPAAGELDADDRPALGLPLFAFFAATACALLAGRVAAAAFALVWFGLSFGGLVAIYWIQTLPLASHLSNSSYRTVATLASGAPRSARCWPAGRRHAQASAAFFSARLVAALRAAPAVAPDDSEPPDPSFEPPRFEPRP